MPCCVLAQCLTFTCACGMHTLPLSFCSLDIWEQDPPEVEQADPSFRSRPRGLSWGGGTLDALPQLGHTILETHRG